MVAGTGILARTTLGKILALHCAIGALTVAGPTLAETWRGLKVAPEFRCSEYDKRRDYLHSPAVEHRIMNEMGAIYGPYTGKCFMSTSETDIEHIVATSEAHDSGLCAQDRETRSRFANDIRNLTLAAPEVNRYEKSGKDASEWIPVRNRCWFAAKVVEVRRAYGLTIDRHEAAALEDILTDCQDTEMEPIVCHVQEMQESTKAVTGDGNEALALYDDNGNGRITCKEARRHGIAPVPRGHPAYRYMRDGDGDGVVCE